MADLIDMAKTPEQKAKDAKPYDERSTADVPDYAWGLTIRLENDDLVRLGITDVDEELPLKIQAIGMVTECSTVMVGGVTRRSMSIQLQKMAVTQEAEKADAAETLYGNAKVNTVSLDG